jgi:aconitate hydratase
MLRKRGVVGKFVEFYGPGLKGLPVADRATIANMAPEYGATCGIFPVDAETIKYLRLTGRSADQIALVEAYCREQGIFHTEATPEATYSDTLELDLSTVEPCVAGPKRPQDRVRLSDAGRSFTNALPSLLPPGAVSHLGKTPSGNLTHGAVVIAAITSCTNTSNPSVMIAAGLLAQKAVERGLTVKPWVKTSLAPGSLVVTEYFQKSGLDKYLEKLNFHTVGYGCTTCIGNSGPLRSEISKAIEENKLVVASVLSGNRNFEGRINPEVRANYLMSPPLVVAYAIAGRIDLDLHVDPLGTGSDGKPVFLKDVWPTSREVAETMTRAVEAPMFTKVYEHVFEGNAQWRSLDVPTGETFAWDARSTYVKHPPYFVDMPKQPAPVEDISGARVLAVLGDSVTTDHISPAGSIKKDSPAGKYLIASGVDWKDFNSYGSRRGNHEVMVRGTFANVRLRNRLAPGTEGGFTRHLPDGAEMTIFEASQKYLADKVPLLILAGKEYGSGSSRDWAAKGTLLLGVRAVIAESYERIHRSNLVGMGVLPLEFENGQNAESLGLTGEETYDIVGLSAMLASNFAGGRGVTVRVTPSSGASREVRARVRIDTPQEILYYQHGGILQFVLRQLSATK